MNSYYSEMGEKRPEDTQIDATLCHYGKHYYIKTRLKLSGRGIVLEKQYGPGDLVPSAQHRVGEYRYRVTIAAMEKLEKQYKVSSEALL